MAQKVNKRSIMNRVQMRRALDLRSMGASYQKIGQGMAISKTRAYQLVMAGFFELDADLKDTAASLRELELLRLDAIVLAHWPARANPRNAEILIRVSERRARLLGLDAPHRVAATTSVGKEPTAAFDPSRLTDDQLAALDSIYAAAILNH
jgi:hypothetical protein